MGESSVEMYFPNDEIKQVNRKGIVTAFTEVRQQLAGQTVQDHLYAFANFQDAKGKEDSLIFAISLSTDSEIREGRKRLCTAGTTVETVTDEELVTLCQRTYNFFGDTTNPKNVYVTMNINFDELDPQSQGEGFSSGSCFIEPDVIATVIELYPVLKDKTIIAEMRDASAGREKHDGTIPDRFGWTDNIARALKYTEYPQEYI